MDIDPRLGVPSGHVVDGDDAFVIVARPDTVGVAAPDTVVHVPQDVVRPGAGLPDVEGRAGAAAMPGGHHIPLAVDGALGVEANGALGDVAGTRPDVHHEAAPQRRVAVEDGLPAGPIERPRAGQVAHLPGPDAEGEPAA